jgi:hypothetical protein
MSAEVIAIGSVPRSSLPSSYDEVFLDGFKKALHALDALKKCDMRETIVAIENWVGAGLVTEAQATELMHFHGWRRG